MEEIADLVCDGDSSLGVNKPIGVAIVNTIDYMVFLHPLFANLPQSGFFCSVILLR